MQKERYLIGVDPAAPDSDKCATTVFKSIGEVVAMYRSRPAQDYMKDVERIAQYYGAATLNEDEELIITEDADVISIETLGK